MPESLFGVSLRPLPAPQQSVTDTATPATFSLPVYFLHSFEHPFCTTAHCPCQAHRQAVVSLFISLIEGRLELEPAAALLTECGKEGRA